MIAMKARAVRETPIERIFREVVGRKMNLIEKHILLRTPKYKLKPYKNSDTRTRRKD
jgi:hypothetical protein